MKYLNKHKLGIIMEDIDKGFEIFGDDIGFQKNVEYVISLREEEIISEEEYFVLRKYNRTQYSNLPI